MATPAALLLIMVVFAVPAVYARVYTPGDSSGWNTGVDYNTWASGKTFVVGDSLLFVYGSLHGVDQVNQADYNGCSSSNAITSYSGGNTNFNLTAPGSYYFLCPTPGHCGQGMKLAVTVSATGIPSTNNPPPPPPPPPRSGATRQMVNGVGLGAALMVLAPLVAFLG
ncbi:hypothetical protein ACLOJK_033859 [Asimina triloba]